MMNSLFRNTSKGEEGGRKGEVLRSKSSRDPSLAGDRILKRTPLPIRGWHGGGGRREGEEGELEPLCYYVI